MRSSRGYLSQKIYGDPQRMMGHQQERRVLDALGQTEALLGQLSRNPVLSPHEIKPPQPPQDREELRALPDLLGQRSCSRIHVFDLRSPPAFGDHQRRAQGGLQTQLLPDAFRGVREELEQLES